MVKEDSGRAQSWSADPFMCPEYQVKLRMQKYVLCASDNGNSGEKEISEKLKFHYKENHNQK